MRMRVALTVLMVFMGGYAASAAEQDNSGYDEITVISVTPRSVSTRPFVMAIFTKEQRERVAAALKKDAFEPKDAWR